MTKLTTSELLLEGFQILNILFPSIPFIFQIKKFYDNKSSIGFSRKVSLIIIIASLLRVFFWFGKRFHWTLLAQSLLLILMQLFVIATSIKFRDGHLKESKEIKDDKARNLLLSEKQNKFYSLEWNSSIYYIAFISFFIIILSILSLILTFQNVYYVETLGTISSFLEAALMLPQIYENCKYKSTINLSNVLVFCWILGDSMKTFYYFVSKAPIQLMVSGFAQIFLDLIIVIQVCIYRENKITSVDNYNVKEAQ